MKISVVIVNYNVKAYLWQCLRSVLRALEGLDGEVIVVDNHSRDGSVAMLHKCFPTVRVVASAENLGFSRGNNKALRMVKGDYVLLLNPDTLVGEDVLHQAIAFMDAHPDAGAAGVRMMRSNGTDANEARRGCPTPMVALYKMLGLCARWPSHRLFGRYYMGWLPWTEAAEIDVVSGAFFLIRRRALDEVGLLDEDFFMYGEDIDLSCRLKEGGWKNWFLPLRILHYKGESTEKTSFRYVHVFYNAMLIFFRKHYGHLALFISLPIRLAIVARACLSLIAMAVQRLARMTGLSSRKDIDQCCYIFHTTDEKKEQCRAMAERHGLEARLVVEEGVLTTALPTELEDNVRPCCHVYDAENVPMKDILDLFSGNPRPADTIGMFYPSQNLLITETTVLGDSL